MRGGQRLESPNEGRLNLAKDVIGFYLKSPPPALNIDNPEHAIVTVNLGLGDAFSDGPRRSLLIARVDLGVAAFQDEFDRTAVTLRYGLDDNASKTIAEVGRTMSYSTGHMRQLLGRSLARFASIPERAAFFNFLLLPEMNLGPEAQDYLQQLRRYYGRDPRDTTPHLTVIWEN